MRFVTRLPFFPLIIYDQSGWSINYSIYQKGDTLLGISTGEIDKKNEGYPPPPSPFSVRRGRSSVWSLEVPRESSGAYRVYARLGQRMA
jgi:hypothetical protein